MAQDEPQEGRSTRRQAVMTALGAIVGFISAALVVPLVVFLFGPAVRGKSSWGLLGRSIPPTPRSREPWVRVGDLGPMPQGDAVLTTVRLPVQEGWIQSDMPVTVYVRRSGPDSATIYDIHCTHMGCPVRWNQAAGRFLCPCHGGVFDGDGHVLSGPPPRPLDRYAVKVDAGVLYMGALELPGT
ncbi:MAG TPA: ubiquinol-cytochrome c reductase iron-sulfur subunit [bacterium]|nr:ubiquinol-cytochrome c reductase iron-sulfur subunit [bacterium]